MKQVLGRLEKDIAIGKGIVEHVNKSIVMYPEIKRHVENRHLHDFKEKATFYYVLSNLDYIINNPDEVFYLDNEKTLYYIKKMNNNILIIVRVEEGRELKVRSFYPIEQSKIDTLRRKEAWEKYVK